MELFDESFLKVILTIGNSLFLFAFFLFLLYVIQAQSFRSRTAKYKFVSEKERPAMLGSAVILASSIGAYAFILIGLSIGLSASFQYFISGILAIGLGFTVGYVLWNYLSYYQPFILEKRLNDIRFGTMKSPVTGKPMTLLNEEQEDIHLTRQMIEEEDNLSVDYDVWIDEASDFKVIERYNTRFHPLVCESCNFRTLTERTEEIIEEPEEHTPGLLRKHYECTYCGHVAFKDAPIPSWSEEGKFEHFEKDITELPDRKTAPRQPVLMNT